jgi:hypothetical protein
VQRIGLNILLGLITPGTTTTTNRRNSSNIIYIASKFVCLETHFEVL